MPALPSAKPLIQDAQFTDSDAFIRLVCARFESATYLIRVRFVPTKAALVPWFRYQHPCDDGRRNGVTSATHGFRDQQTNRLGFEMSIDIEGNSDAGQLGPKPNGRAAGARVRHPFDGPFWEPGPRVARVP